MMYPFSSSDLTCSVAVLKNYMENAPVKVILRLFFFPYFVEKLFLRLLTVCHQTFLTQPPSFRGNMCVISLGYRIYREISHGIVPVGYGLELLHGKTFP